MMCCEIDSKNEFEKELLTGFPIFYFRNADILFVFLILNYKNN